MGKWDIINTALGGATIIGAILTAIGTYVTIKNARKVKSIRDEVLSDRKKIVLLGLKSHLQGAIKAAEKMGTRIDKRVRRGSDRQEFVDDIRRCMASINEHSHRFGSDSLKDKAGEVESLLGRYLSEQEPEEQWRIGDEVLVRLREMEPILTQEVDESV